MKWEYKILHVYESEMTEAVLDGYGGSGWEVIAIRDGSVGIVVYCKRPVGWIE